MFVVCLIVKNEAATIAKTLASVKETLGSELRAIVVHDTGSTDDTVELCEAAGAFVFCVQWMDYATNRNAALESGNIYAKARDVLLMLDAGTILRGTSTKLPVRGLKPSTTAWNVTVRLSDTSYKRPQLFAKGKQWPYVGRVHEAVVRPEGAAPAEDSGLTVDYCLPDTARADRWQRDLVLLEDDYTPRGRFYYAQTLELLGRPAEGFFWYMHRAARTDGWHQERCMAYIRAIPMAPSYVLAQWCAAQALAIDPTRGEASLQMALYGASCATDPLDWMVVHNNASEALLREPAPDSLFVDMTREWKARELCARATFYQGQKALARMLWTQLLSDVPDYAQNQIRENLRFCDE